MTSKSGSIGPDDFSSGMLFLSKCQTGRVEIDASRKNEQRVKEVALAAMPGPDDLTSWTILEPDELDDELLEKETEARWMVETEEMQTWKTLMGDEQKSFTKACDLNRERIKKRQTKLVIQIEENEDRRIIEAEERRSRLQLLTSELKSQEYVEGIVPPETEERRTISMEESSERKKLILERIKAEFSPDQTLTIEECKFN